MFSSLNFSFRNNFRSTLNFRFCNNFCSTSNKILNFRDNHSFLLKIHRSLCKKYNLEWTEVSPNVFLLIILFMSQFKTIKKEMVSLMTFDNMIHVFMTSSISDISNPESFRNFIKEAQWDTKSPIVAYKILQDFRTLIEGEPLVCNRIVFFDQHASGFSILALLSNSKFGVTEANIFSNEISIRSCIYTTFLKSFRKSLRCSIDNDLFDRK